MYWNWLLWRVRKLFQTSWKQTHSLPKLQFENKKKLHFAQKKKTTNWSWRRRFTMGHRAPEFPSKQSSFNWMANSSSKQSHHQRLTKTWLSTTSQFSDQESSIKILLAVYFNWNSDWISFMVPFISVDHLMLDNRKNTSTGEPVRRQLMRCHNIKIDSM